MRDITRRAALALGAAVGNWWRCSPAGTPATIIARLNALSNAFVVALESR
jgi:hypothetical protein